jgi:peptidyl-dipeptidase A
MATVLEHFATDNDWLRENTELASKEIARFAKAEKAARLLRLRNLVALSTFEFQAFEDLSQDLNELWSKTQARYLFVSENLTPKWAAQSIYTTHPVYFQNYVLSEMIAAQTIAYLQQKHGQLLNNAEVSKFLIENYFGPGASIDWPDKIKRATGQRLSAKALAQELAA